MRPRRLVALILAAAAAPGMASCAPSVDDLNKPQLVTHERTGESMAAIVQGELGIVGQPPGCFAVMSGTATYLAMFPGGTQSSIDSVTVAGMGETRIGQEVKVGGGYVIASDLDLQNVPTSCITDEIVVITP